MPPPPLPADALRRRCVPETLAFETTKDLPDIPEMLGQSRAVAALRFGVAIRHPDYHVFALGSHGVGKLSAVRRLLALRAADEPVSSDFCYVHRFSDPQRPRALELPRGRGRELERDMRHVVDELRAAIPAAFESDEFRTRREAIVEEAKGRQEQALESLQTDASAEGVTLVRTPVGIALAPVRDGKPLTPDQFEALSDDDKARVKQSMEKLGKRLEEIARQVPQWEREARQKVRDLARETTRFAVDHLLDEVRKRWQDLPQVLGYLDEVQGDVVENAPELLKPEGSGTPDQPFMSGSGKLGPLRRYQVNVLVDRAEEKGAPVVYEDHPTHPNLFGRVEHVSVLGALVTDFTLLRAGALHRANGGYLVLDAIKLLTQPFSYEELKRVLRARALRIEGLAQSLGLVSTVSLEPEPIPLRTKIVLVGERRVYYLLSLLDPEFSELFKVPADFDDTVDWDGDEATGYAQLVATIAREEGLRPLERGAVARVVEHAARLADDARKLSVHRQSLHDLLCEADHLASLAPRDAVTTDDVEQALRAREHRADRVRERLYEAIERRIVLVDPRGERVGQIHGLSVIQLGDFAFGTPARITARVRLGKGNVVDIEREVELGGPLHSKGVLILQGFLASRYARDVPLTLTASLVFEQSYGGVDGDSASGAELVALLTAIAKVPVRQWLAMTGSVSQLGDVQAIGGVNEKIEGWFDVCARLAPTETPGVIIPRANVQHLMLRPDVVEACARGAFHVWAVSTIDEALELLTGLPAGEPAPDGTFPEGSLNRRIDDALRALATAAAAFRARSDEEKGP